MSETYVYLDETPGETRGIIETDNVYQHLIIRRDDDPLALCLGARSVGRVRNVQPAYGGAFIDLPGDGGHPAFLKLGKVPVLEGQAVEVEVTTEPREDNDKGAVVRLIGPADGDPRLLAPGPTVGERLALLAPGAEVITGWEATQASFYAEEDARTADYIFGSTRLDVSVQRTRALIAVDIDYTHEPGRNVRKLREQTNIRGMAEAARMIRLNGWGGLVVIDFAGTQLNTEVLLAEARKAFADPQTVFGPFSRFGTLQLSLPWTVTPLEDRIGVKSDLRPSKAVAIDIARRLRHELLRQSWVPRFVAVINPWLVEALAPLVAQLGPRAYMRPDPDVRVSEWRVEEG